MTAGKPTNINGSCEHMHEMHRKFTLSTFFYGVLIIILITADTQSDRHEWHYKYCKEIAWTDESSQRSQVHFEQSYRCGHNPIPASQEPAQRVHTARGQLPSTCTVVFQSHRNIDT